MELTNQERKNHKRFKISFILMFLFIASLELASIKFAQTENMLWILLFSMGLFGTIFNTLWMFYIGYSHGWELKRISIEED